MTGPGDEIAAGAAGRGRLRASRADREQVIGTLKAAFVQGRLARDEFDLRVSQVFASRTYAELAALTADLPAGLAAAQPRAQGEQPVLRPGPVIAVATALYAGGWGYELFLTPRGGDNPWFPPLIFGGFILYLGVLLICVGAILASQRDKRSGGQPPARQDLLTRPYPPGTR
jgi:uncharacterized protein DUF1707